MSDHILVCAPAGVPGSVKGTITGKYCSKCGQEVQVAPAGQEFLQNNPTTVIQCIICVLAASDLHNNVEPAPGAVAELLSHLLNQRRN